MTALMLTDDFVEKALETGRLLLASGKDILELEDARGNFVAKKGAELPEGATSINEFEIDGTMVILFTIS